MWGVCFCCLYFVVVVGEADFVICLTVVLIKGISQKICILYVCVKINKLSFEPFCV